MAGATGAQGPAGQNGLSAYEIAVQNGYAGTESQWLSTAIVGPQGPQGIAGANGIDGATGPQGPQGIQGLTGAAGPQGPQGIQGEQGLQGPQGVAGTNGTNGVDGTQGPIGLTGPAGQNGQNGTNGIDGLSAYQIWLNAGNIGSETDFLNSISSNVIGVTSSSIIYYMEPGTYLWNKPLNVNKIKVKLLGAGGAGGVGASIGCIGGSGGSGAYVEGVIDVSQYSQLTITVGEKGNALPTPTNGGASSIGNIVVAGGGFCGSAGGQFGPGASGSGGVAVGQNCFLLNGASGQSTCTVSSPGIPKISLSYPSINSNEKVYGMGGISRTNTFGTNGTSGFIIIEY